MDRYGKTINKRPIKHLGITLRKKRKMKNRDIKPPKDTTIRNKGKRKSKQIDNTTKRKTNGTSIVFL